MHKRFNIVISFHVAVTQPMIAARAKAKPLTCLTRTRNSSRQHCCLFLTRMLIYSKQLSRAELPLTAFDLLSAERIAQPIKTQQYALHTYFALIEYQIKRELRSE